MSFVRTLLATGPTTPLSRYIEINGVMYAALGLTLFFFPGGLALIGASPLQGQEAGLVSALGMTLLIIGWFYVMGGRTRADSYGLATVVDRLLVPFFLVPLWWMGALDPYLALPFAIADPLLGLGAFAVWRWQRTSDAYSGSPASSSTLAPGSSDT